MNPLEIILTREAQEDIRRLPPIFQKRILDKLEWIGENASLLHHQALQGDEWQGCFKYRVGDYRIIYQLDWPHGQLIVLKIAHRRHVYE